MSELTSISSTELDSVTGGGAATKVAGKVLRKVGAKFIPGVNIASTAYDAYEGVQGYQKSRAQGNGVGRSVWEGAKSFAGFGDD